MAINLTRDAIAMVCNNQADDLKPVLQITDIKLVNTVQNNTERYRMLLSDGTHLQQAMLATQMNHIVKSGKLKKGSIVQLTEFICSLIQNRKIIIIINLEVIMEHYEPIGEPKHYTDGTGNVPNAPQRRVSAPTHSPSNAQPVPQSSGSSLSNGHTTAQAISNAPLIQHQTDPVVNPPSHNSSYVGGQVLGRNTSSGAQMYPKGESDITGSVSVSRFDNNNVLMGNNQNYSNPYGHPLQPAYNQPPPVYTNRGPIAKNEAPARIIPISALNPYQGRWTIKARVTTKGELRRYSNPRGEGKVFSFDLLDADGGEIRVTCFNSVVDQFYDQIEAGKVYMFSRGSLKPSQKKFNHLNNDYEIHLESTSIIQPCFEEDKSIPKQQFNFRPIIEIESIDNESMVDIIGIVTSINPSGTVMRKNGTETQKRSLQMKDTSGRSVELTMWGTFCSTEGQQLQALCDSGTFPVLAVKSARVSEFNGKTIGTISTSKLFINPDLPESSKLIDWFIREGKNTISPSISRESSNSGRMDVRKTISQIKDEGLGRGDKPDWITVKATISFIKVDNFCYTACPLMVGDRQCNKKVTNNGDGHWLCERCDRTIPECDYRYLLQLQIQDHTGLTWVTAFQECGEEIMGITAKKLYLLKYEEQDDVKFGEIVRKVLFDEHIFKLKVKEEMFSDEQRVKSTVVKSEKVNFSDQARFLLSCLEKMSGGNPHGFTVSHLGNTTSTSQVDRVTIPPINQIPSLSIQGDTRVSSSGNLGGYMYCDDCGRVGHTSQNCSMVVNRQPQPTLMVTGMYGNRLPNTGSGIDNASASGKCFKCNQSGHWARDCPGSSGGPPPSYRNEGFVGRY